MATNADNNNVDDDDKQVSEEDLRDLKYPKDDVETSDSEEDEASEEEDDSEEESEDTGDEDGQTDDEAEEGESEEDEKTDSDDDTPDFVKQFSHIKGETPEEYARNLEIAYQNSTAEALRLKELSEKAPPVTDAAQGDDESDDEITSTDPVSLFMKQKMDEEIDAAYADFSKQYTQVSDPAEYDKFTREVSTLSRTILTSQGRMASPRELYSKAAVILDWKPQETAPSNEEKVGMALKDNASNTKTSSSPKKKAARSKVTDAMIQANRLMYPNKSDDEIRKELEPFV